MGFLIVTFDEGGLNQLTSVNGSPTPNAITSQGQAAAAKQPGPNIGPLVAGGQPLTSG